MKFLPITLLLIPLMLTGEARAQDRAQYMLGQDNRLEMIVYIIGEVKKPGEYRVLDTANLLELLSKAEGPTQFSKMSSVTITRIPPELLVSRSGLAPHAGKKQVIKFNIDEYLRNPNNVIPPPKLKPGDVVMVPRNTWSTWKSVATVIRDLSVIASAYFLYLRAIQN